MCISSYIGQDFNDKYKVVPPIDNLTKNPPNWQKILIDSISPPANKKDIEDAKAELKAEILELKELLIKAQQYDIVHNEPHCEHEDKITGIKSAGEAVGVDMTSCFDAASSLDNHQESAPYEGWKVLSISLTESKVEGSFASKETAEKFAEYIRKYLDANGDTFFKPQLATIFVKEGFKAIIVDWDNLSVVAYLDKEEDKLKFAPMFSKSHYYFKL